MAGRPRSCGTFGLCSAVGGDCGEFGSGGFASVRFAGFDAVSRTSGDFAQAEDWLFRLCESSPAQGGLEALGAGFYRRLSAQPDSILAGGGLEGVSATMRPVKSADYAGRWVSCGDGFVFNGVFRCAADSPKAECVGWDVDSIVRGVFFELRFPECSNACSCCILDIPRRVRRRLAFR